ncbi:DUF6894 family protein [Bradyrhizobium sp. AZCC 2289]|uniref:DUF6894 family protein n=1 Tax=Bradyrhizobium sp. AZCC 2289 TaxID=3117026 RepID=UPI003044CEAE
MPRYFFNICDGHSHQDKDGEEMQDDQTAWRGATELARSIQEALLPGERWSLEVLDGEAPVFRIEVSTQKFR